MRDKDNQESQPDVARRIAGWMIGLMWLLILWGAMVMAQRWIDQRALEREARVQINAYGQDELLLQADRYGQYMVEGSANDQPVSFLLDTGATGISIPEAVALKLGLKAGRPYKVITANGTIQVYHTELDSLQVGPFIRRNVKAHINPAMQGEIALLGMSFLRHYQLIQRSGELAISQP